MSNEALFWAWRVDIDGTRGVSAQAAKLVLIRLADQANSDGVCWPGNESLCRATALGRATVTRTIKYLSDSGYISITHRIGRDGRQETNLYQLHLAGAHHEQRTGAHTGAHHEHQTQRVEPKGVVPNGTTNVNLEQVWGAYLAHHPAAKLTSARRQLILRRLRDYPPEVLVAAVEGNHLDPWCNGENPSGKKYHGIELILRGDKIEQYAQIAVDPPKGRSGRVNQALSDWLRRSETEPGGRGFDDQVAGAQLPQLEEGR